MKFSMILPVHNAAGFMGRMLNSIKDQSWKDYELIVICDNCRDNSYEIALDYAKDWPAQGGMTVVAANYGIAGLARNHGLELARGDWVLFADDDDWMLHEYVFAQLAAMTEEHADIVACSFIWRGVGYYAPTRNDFNPAVWNKAWRREFIGDTRFSNRMYGDDADFTNAMLAKSPRVIFWDMPIYYYNYLRGGSLTDLLQKGEL